MLFYRARYYQSTLGRFISEDPITSPGLANVANKAAVRGGRGFALTADALAPSATIRSLIGPSDYAYVRSSPAAFRDPLGLLGEPNQKPGQPYCDWGKGTPPVCPPKWCQPFSKCVQKCYDIFIPSNWMPGLTLTALGLKSIAGQTGAAYQGVVVLVCVDHCVAYNGCKDFADQWIQ